MQTGQLIAFVNYLTRVLMGLMMVSMLVMRLARAQASAERIQEVLDSEPEVQNPARAGRTLRPARAGWPSKGSPSATATDEDPVLKGINFTAEPGQTVAILGATGSGKSSLVHLIPRFYDVTGGRVTLDGVDVRDMDEAELRRNIGIALQESVLFSGTIRDNIRYGRPEASDEEVIAAAKAAQAHDFILDFPTATTRGWASAGSTCRAGRNSASPSPGRSAHPAGGADPGRQHQLGGRGDRKPDPGGPGRADARAHQLRDRPAHQHGAERRQDPGAG